MTSSKDAVNKVFDQLLGRSAGTEGQGYWGKQWEDTKAAAIASGKSAAQAEAEATASISKGVGSSSEAFEYVSGTSDKATTAYDSAAAGVPDWFQFQDENVAIGARPEDWATDLQQSNLQNYVDHQNYTYGMLQGNTVGQEGNEWWGYQQTQDIQSHLAAGKSWDEANKLATDKIAKDIMANTGHINYEKYGSIGYGNPLEIATQYDDQGVAEKTEKVYLNLHQEAINQGILNKTGTKIATQYELDEDGNYAEDAEGNRIPMMEDGEAKTATPFKWEMVEDAKAPGGYRITAVPFLTGTQGPSIKGHEFIANNYQQDGIVQGIGGKKTFEIPTDYTVKNVDGSQFTGDDALAIAQWQNTPEGKQAIAAGNYAYKNKSMMDHDGDGMLDHVPSNMNHTTHDSNLGLNLDQEVGVNWGNGWRTGFKGTYNTATYGDSTGFEVGEELDKDGLGVRYGSGTGNTIINIDQNLKSKTAAQQTLKQDDRGQISGQGKKGFQNKVQGLKGNIRNLGIPGTKNQSLLV